MLFNYVALLFDGKNVLLKISKTKIIIIVFFLNSLAGLFIISELY
jgi:hypothetical protein